MRVDLVGFSKGKFYRIFCGEIFGSRQRALQKKILILSKEQQKTRIQQRVFVCNQSPYFFLRRLESSSWRLRKSTYALGAGESVGGGKLCAPPVDFCEEKSCAVGADDWAD